MPELPEVEVVRRDLESYFHKHPKIEGVLLLREGLRDPFPKKALIALIGGQFKKAHRRGKYLVIETSKGNLVSHLGMTGSWRLEKTYQPRRHDHAILKLSGSVSLIYCDPRRFGILEVAPDRWQKHHRFAALGVEPLLEGEINVEEFWIRLKQRKVTIKALLMDQKMLVGVGNIYASEALFRAGIKPMRRASRLKLAETDRLLREIRSLLLAAIASGGSTISDFSHGGGEGRFQKLHQVYGRAGQACFICGHIIRGKIISGRSSFWCSTCQN